MLEVKAESKQIKARALKGWCGGRRSDWRDFLSWQGRYEKGRERAAHKRALVWREQALGLHQRYVRPLHRLHLYTRRRPTLSQVQFWIKFREQRKSEHSDSALGLWAGGMDDDERICEFVFFLCVYFGLAEMMNRNALTSGLAWNAPETLTAGASLFLLFTVCVCHRSGCEKGLMRRLHQQIECTWSVAVHFDGAGASLARLFTCHIRVIAMADRWINAGNGAAPEFISRHQCSPQ